MVKLLNWLILVNIVTFPELADFGEIGVIAIFDGLRIRRGKERKGKERKREEKRGRGRKGKEGNKSVKESFIFAHSTNSLWLRHNLITKKRYLCSLLMNLVSSPNHYILVLARQHKKVYTFWGSDRRTDRHDVTLEATPS